MSLTTGTVERGRCIKKNCGCKLIKTCQFSSSQHEGMYFTAKEIYTRTTNLSSFYGTSCRFINNSLPRIFFLNINSNRISVDLAALAALCSSNKATKAMLKAMAGIRGKSSNPSLPDKITTQGEDVESIAKMVGNAQSEETG